MTALRKPARGIARWTMRLFASIAVLLIVFSTAPAQAASAASVPQQVASSYLLADACPPNTLPPGPDPDKPCTLELESIPKSANYTALAGFWPILGAIITVLAAVSIILGLIGMPIGFIWAMFGGKGSKAHTKGNQIKASSLQLALYGVAGVMVMQLIFRTAIAIVNTV